MRICERFSPSVSLRKTAASWLSDLSEALDALVFPWSCALCEMEGVSGPLCEACREDLLESRTQAENPCVRAVPSRRVHLQIYAVAVLHAGTAPWASTRRLRWGHMRVNFANYV